MLERRSIDIFIGQERYDLEQREIFRVEPVPMSLSAVIPNAGSVVAIDSYGRNIILTRAKDGVVRAFINARSHKGSKLIEDDARSPPLASYVLIAPGLSR
jgi:phenylpropionate dioxygenase-like ring-hydroxylating dioxygenase large terminal subunit